MRNAILLSVLILIGCSISTYAVAQTESSASREINEILDAVADMVMKICLHPDNRGHYIQVEVEGDTDSKALINIPDLLGIELSGKVEIETWNGIKEKLAKYRNYARICAIKVLPSVIDMVMEIYEQQNERNRQRNSH